jgi:cytoskeleton protein RodZ
LATFGIGSTLQQERLRQGLSLEEIAARTRISRRFLQAIEVEDFASLPGAVFTRNFVRQFTVTLGMDPAPLLALLPRIDIESVPLPDASKFPATRRLDPRWANALSSFLWIALAGGVAAGAYVYFTPKSAPVALTSASKNAPAGRAASQAAPSVSPNNEASVPLAAVPQVTSSEASAPQAQIAPGDAGRPVQVVLKAREASWVQIIADGRNAFTGMLNANDSREVGADALVKVTAGNAGGLEISLNGKSLTPLGSSGQVKTIRLTAEGPQMVLKPASSPL